MVDTTVQKFGLVFVYNKVFYPFVYPDILVSLRNRKYSTVALPSPLPMGSRIYVGGQIAKKDAVTIIAKDDSKILATEGTSIEKVIASAEDLIQIATEDFHLDLEKDLSYFELQGDFVIKTDSNPLVDIQKFVVDKYGSFNDILGEETSPYVISIVPKGSDLSKLRWFDIRLEPRSISPESAFYLNIVYRDHSIISVMNFARDISNKIDSMMKIICEA
jgi:hypothetical protein